MRLEAQKMAYNAVAQVDHEVASDSDSDDLTPAAHRAFQSLRDHGHLGGAPHLEPAPEEPRGLAQLSSIISSMTAPGYEIVEADDYAADPSPDDPHQVPPLNTTVARHSSPGTPLRSASSNVSIPLSHPTPDLQSLQGAYIGNVERLELSAERLSSSTADIGSEIRKMDQEQKRQSCSSASNSVVMRNGAFSPITLPSPHGSTRSTRQRSVSGASRLAQVTEPAHDEDGQLDGPHSSPSNFPVTSPRLPSYANPVERYYGQHDAQVFPEEIERPPTAASGDTYHQARTLFTDFDGVHYAPSDRMSSGRQVSINRPPLARNQESHKEPQAGENMVYYPAPIPRILNLPPKLSRKPPVADREKRRTQILNDIAAEDRKAASGRAESGQDVVGDASKEKRKSALPPQLRASVFFEPPSQTIELDRKGESAVATLDDILDASANAPVSAFTDHPYAGHVGSYIYAQEKTLTKQKQKSRPLRREHSSESSDDSSVSSQDEWTHARGEHDTENSGSEAEGDEYAPGGDAGLDYVGPPNTLLAELEMRKQELKMRRRTALPTVGHVGQNGGPTTLLEMDTIAQKQSEKRRRRPVTLAWDGRDAPEDDDVPLALLYPEKSATEEEGDNPQGLIGRQQFEDNEPLSTRRARLRGEPIPQKRPVTMYSTRPPPLPQSKGVEEDEDEVETLAERLKRMKGQDPTESDFSHDLLAEFDTRFKEPSPEPAPVAPQEETLAQRRSRLQKEGAQPNAAKNPRMRNSMATLPQMRQSMHLPRKPSQDLLRPQTMQTMQTMQTTQYGNQLNHRMSMQRLPTHMGYQMQQQYPMAQQMQYGYGMGYSPAKVNPGMYGYNSTMLAMHNMGYPSPSACAPPTIRQPDPAQRDVIDRWRQSIR
ncbi:hypothetical protein N7468_010255 [Penicillium chermesinum]|uniref:Uncharacterized protein n=1 Tax=Penicillium chermesinum TaxID=63820 RepID=A0A9W9TC30_9EURO|nr:uncharacterized protein N7468_010255 [Penicillium chermesinum]KAJ5217247.1 hypothetical protein N7468_010255 [Penicillium chermesinum]